MGSNRGNLRLFTRAKLVAHNRWQQNSIVLDALMPMNTRILAHIRSRRGRFVS